MNEVGVGAGLGQPSGGGNIFGIAGGGGIAGAGGGGRRQPQQTGGRRQPRNRFDTEAGPAALRRPNWLQALRNYWQQGAAGPTLGTAQTPALMMAGDLALGPQYVAAAKTLGQKTPFNPEQVLKGRGFGGNLAPAPQGLGQGVMASLGLANEPGVSEPGALLPTFDEMRAEASSLAQGFYEWTNPETGETMDVPLPEDVTSALESQGAEPAPVGGEGEGNLLPDTWKQQRARWLQMMNAILGVSPTVMPDTYYGQMDRLLENYYGANPYDNTPYDVAYAGQGWYGGGGGGGGSRDPMFWLDRVKWNIV